RSVGIAGGVLDGAADEAGDGGHADGFGDRLGGIAEASFEVGGDGQIHRFDDGARVRDRLFAGDAAVPASEAGGGGGAGGGQGGEAETGQQAGGDGIPRVGNHEGGGAVV